MSGGGYGPSSSSGGMGLGGGSSSAAAGGGKSGLPRKGMQLGSKAKGGASSLLENLAKEEGVAVASLEEPTAPLVMGGGGGGHVISGE
jgi:hypothetical protein